MQGSWLKPGVSVIDCGMNNLPDATKKSGFRWVGDVEFATAKDVARAITPVPGGVGPMTVAMLVRNTLVCAEQMAPRLLWALRKLPLNIIRPPPSDIAIATAQRPKFVADLGKEIGLETSEVRVRVLQPAGAALARFTHSCLVSSLVSAQQPSLHSPA